MKATPREYVNASQEGAYVPHQPPARPGAEDALRIPSRMGDRLHYRDGRVVPVPTEADLAEQALGTGHRRSRVCRCGDCRRYFAESDMEGA